MKKVFFCFFSICLFVLGLVSCDEFLSGSNLKNQIEEIISYENAEFVNVTISPQNVTDGQVLNPVESIKVGFWKEISFEPNLKFGNFECWRAYSNYTGTSQDVELTEDVIEFENKSFRNTKVIIKQQIENLRILPCVSENPHIWLNAPKNSSGIQVGKISPFGEVNCNPLEPLSIKAVANSEYAIVGWEISKEGMENPELYVQAKDDEGYDISRPIFNFKYEGDASKPAILFDTAIISEDQSESSANVIFNTGDINGLTLTPIVAVRPEITISPAAEEKIRPNQRFVVSMDTYIYTESYIEDCVFVEYKTPGSSEYKSAAIKGPDFNDYKSFWFEINEEIEDDSDVKVIITPILSSNIEIKIAKEYTYKYKLSKKLVPPEITDINFKYHTGTKEMDAEILDKENFSILHANVKKSTQDKKLNNNTEQFCVNISSDSISEISSYVVEEKLIYIPMYSILPKTKRFDDPTLTTDDYMKVGKEGMLLYDKSGWTGNFSDYEDLRFNTKAKVVETSEKTSALYFSTAIPLGGTHLFKIYAVDVNGNKSSPKYVYMNFSGKEPEIPNPNNLPKKNSIDNKWTLSMAVNSKGELTSELNFKKYLQATNSTDADIERANSIKEYVDNAATAFKESKYFISTQWDGHYKISRSNETDWYSRNGQSLANGSGTYYNEYYYALVLNHVVGIVENFTLDICDNYGIPIYINTKLNHEFLGIYSGDFIMYNSRTDYLFVLPQGQVRTYNGFAEPIAIIESCKKNAEGKKEIFGLGLIHSPEVLWCSKDAYFADKLFVDETDAEFDDKNAWNYLVEQETAAGAITWKDPETNYYPFYYCNNYGKNVLGFDVTSKKSNEKALATGWYLSNEHYMDFEMLSVAYKLDKTANSKCWRYKGKSSSPTRAFVGTGSGVKSTSKFITYACYDFTDLLDN